MKILPKLGQKQLKVGEIGPGQVVRFAKKFHSDHCDGDLFLVLTVPASYIPARFADLAERRVGLVNLRTGQLSYIIPSRSVTLLEHAEVCTNED
jgi:hypothetical protein